MGFDSFEKTDLIHIALGGGICFFTMYILLSISTMGIRLLLHNLNSLGLLAFSEALNATSLFLLGTGYIPSGFLGGLYTGYKVKENLKIVFIFPALIGLLGLIILRFFSGLTIFSVTNLQQEILLPLVGNAVGAYLGGYAMNWETEEIVKTSGTTGFELSEVRS